MGMSTEVASASGIPVVDALNRWVERIGLAVAWVNVLLVGVILSAVFMRYGLHQTMVTLEELTWYLYAVGIMFGLSYGIVKNTHIRVDILHMHFPRKMQYVVEILGILFLLMPFVLVILHHSIEWVWQSYTIGESSSSPQGLSNRWIIKLVIPVTFLLMFLAALARLIESWVLLRRGGEVSNGNQ